MATSVKQQIINQADELQQRFNQAKQQIDQMIPSNQVLVAGELQEDGELLAQLQQEVQATFLRQTGAIPGINEEELLELSEKLSASAEILESIDANTLLATAILELSAEVNSLYQKTSTQNLTQVASLQSRVRDLTETNPFLNRGNREALDVINQVLQSMQAPQIPVASVQTVLSTQPTQISVNTTRQRSGSDDRSLALQKQNEEYHISLFTDQLREINQTLSTDPVKDFDKVLAHYQAMKQWMFSQGKPYASENTGPSIAALLQQTELVLETICRKQELVEGQLVQQNTITSQQSANLNNFKVVLEQALSESEANTDLSKIKAAFTQLTSNEKNNIFDALNSILRKAGQTRDLPNTLRGQPVNIWPGSWKQKKEAVESLLTNGQTTQSTPVVKKSEEMRRHFNEAKNLQPPVLQTTPSQSNQTASHQTQLSNRTEEDIDLDPLNFEDKISSIKSIYSSVAAIEDLQTILALLKNHSTSSQLEEVCEHLQILDSKGLKTIFKMTDMSSRTIADRPFFHLYFIHKNETPEKLKDDMQYGNKAFAGVYPAKNEERIRAVQRAIVEIALENLEDAINFDDDAAVIELLNILESIKLDAKDRAENQENAAYNLFSVFYHLHNAARSNQTSLIDPNAPEFKGDFGREGFLSTKQGIDPAIKLAAINQVCNALKAAWKL